jgi:hypothetical protein
MGMRLIECHLAAFFQPGRPDGGVDLCIAIHSAANPSNGLSNLREVELTRYPNLDTAPSEGAINRVPTS